MHLAYIIQNKLIYNFINSVTRYINFNLQWHFPLKKKRTVTRKIAFYKKLKTFEVSNIRKSALIGVYDLKMVGKFFALSLLLT